MGSVRHEDCICTLGRRRQPHYQCYACKRRTPSTEAIYTVALWNGAADEKYILKTETYFENSITDLFKERVAQTGSIKPEWDEDFILDWSIVKTQPENNAS